MTWRALSWRPFPFNEVKFCASSLGRSEASIGDSFALIGGKDVDFSLIQEGCDALWMMSMPSGTVPALSTHLAIVKTTRPKIL
jgi:hypothetical protein